MAASFLPFCVCKVLSGTSRALGSSLPKSRADFLKQPLYTHTDRGEQGCDYHVCFLSCISALFQGHLERASEASNNCYGNSMINCFGFVYYC